MDRHPHPQELLLEFPCDYLFKAFGANDPEGVFIKAVRAAVSEILPVSLDTIKVSRSTKGSYICVTVLVRLHNFQQLESIYHALRRVDGLKYLL